VCSRIQTYGQARVSAGWSKVYVEAMHGSPALPGGFAAAVNACIRSGWHGWGLAGFADDGPGSGDPCCGADIADSGVMRTNCYSDGDGGLPNANGSMACATRIGWAMKDGGI
jgi:hypothetical protein